MKSIKGATTSIHGKTVIKSTIVPCIAYKDYVEYIEEYKNPLKAIKINYLKNLSYNWLKEESKKYDVEENKTIDNKHDKLFKDLFSDKEEAVKFINKYLELEIPLKAEEIEVYKNGYITRMYQSKEADIVYKIKEKNIFILIEHQSTVDRSMPYRILNYSVAIMNQAVEKNKMKRKDYKYPKVIAIVLYTGREKWKAKIKLEETQENLPGYKEDEVSYTLVDVNEYSTEELLQDNLLITKAMIMEKSRTKEETIKNVEAIANKVIEEKMELGEYLLDVIEKYILSGNVGKEAIKKIEEIRERKGGEEEMLNVVRMLKAENAALRKEGYKEGVREQQKIIARNMLSMKMELEKISKITGLSIEEVKLLKEKIS